MKLAIFGVAAFVLGLGGSTGVLVLTAPAHSPAADSMAVAHARADSLAHHPTLAVAPAPPPAAATSVKAPVHVAQSPDSAIARPAPPASVMASSDGAHAPAVTRVPTVQENAIHEGRSATATAPDAESFKQVGSILLNMKPAEAAKIVGYLNDEQVEGLLRSMSPRQAAGVLGQLPPERGAALSRRLLIPYKEAKP